MQLFGNKKVLPINAEEQLTEAEQIVNKLKPINESIETKSLNYYTQKIMYYILEYTLFIIAGLCILFMIYIEDITPFYIMKEIKARPEIANRISNSDDWKLFGIALRLLVLIPALLFLIIALMLRKRRKLMMLLFNAHKVIKEQSMYFEKKRTQLQNTQE